MINTSVSSSLPPVVGRIAAFLVFSILLNFFILHNSVWKSSFRHGPRDRGTTVPYVKVKVQVEALSPECKAFVNEQLIPFHKIVGSNVIDVQLISFGNSQIVVKPQPWLPDEQQAQATPSQSEVEIHCPHGRLECDAHAYLQCVALNLYPFPARYLPLFGCLYDALLPENKDDSASDDGFDDSSSNSTSTIWQTRRKYRENRRRRWRNKNDNTNSNSDTLDPNRPLDRTIVSTCARRSALDFLPIEACHDDFHQSLTLQRKAESLTTIRTTETLPLIEIAGQPLVNYREKLFEKQVCQAYVQGGGVHRYCTAILS